MSDLTNIHVPEGSTLPQWHDARARIEAYLRALNLAEPKQRERIAALVLERAAAKFADCPEQSPLVRTMVEFQDLSDRWFQQARASDEATASDDALYLAVDGGRKWPGAFLAEDVPVELTQALHACEVRAAPDLRVSRMVPHPFDNLLDDLSLPTALTQLTKDLPPSLVAKVAAVMMSGLALLSGNRIR